jgi:hypothetical protein
VSTRQLEGTKGVERGFLEKLKLKQSQEDSCSTRVSPRVKVSDNSGSSCFLNQVSNKTKREDLLCHIQVRRSVSEDVAILV